jgi:glycosyltransferase involved in cell wall biosynthesis
LEGLPSVGLQAGIMARPIIATRIGGLPEVVVDRKTGLLVAPEDSAELSKAIVYLLEHPEVAVRMGEAGRQRVMNLFSWETCVIEYERLCQQLTRQKTSRASFGAVP